MRRMLFITSSRIGDGVITTGLLGQLLEQVEAVTIVASPHNARLFAAVPKLEHLIVLHKRRASRHWLDLWWRVVWRRWDCVVDCRGSAIGWFLWTNCRLAHRQGRGRIPKVAQLGALIGRAEHPPLPRLWLEPARVAAAARAMAGQRYLAVAPTTNWPGKEWSMANYIELLRRITAANGIFAGYRIAVFSAPSERSRLTPLWQAFSPEQCFDGSTDADLQQVAANLAQCAYFVGNDSGLMHMAAALGVRTLGLFGPSDELVYAPAGVAADLVRSPISCSELHRRRIEFGDLDLMRDLTIEQVEFGLKRLRARGDVIAPPGQGRPDPMPFSGSGGGS
ncbi:MAG: glycosyltransferase family 9 protein [Alphaproteobacteria bacterium]|nr:glycosyltransferase family 9 protein [Alphaproteobacteria bacterium]